MFDANISLVKRIEIYREITWHSRSYSFPPNNCINLLRGSAVRYVFSKGRRLWRALKAWKRTARQTPRKMQTASRLRWSFSFELRHEIRDNMEKRVVLDIAHRAMSTIFMPWRCRCNYYYYYYIMTRWFSMSFLQRVSSSFYERKNFFYNDACLSNACIIFATFAIYSYIYKLYILLSLFI